MSGALTSGAIAAGAAIAAHNMILGKGAMYQHLSNMGGGLGRFLGRQGASKAELGIGSFLLKGLNNHFRI
jgi:hypothetical protein